MSTFDLSQEGYPPLYVGGAIRSASSFQAEIDRLPRDDDKDHTERVELLPPPALEQALRQVGSYAITQS